MIKWGLGPALAILLWILPFSFPTDVQLLSGLLVWIITWWVCEPIPLPVTGLLGATGGVLLGITTMDAAMRPFSHPLIFLFMGGYFIARAMTVHGADERIALYVLTRPQISGSPRRVVFAILCVTAFLSMWITNVATTAMMLPIAIGVLDAVYPRNRSARSHVLIALAFAASIGGVATPIGSTPNILAMGMLEQSAQIQLSFLEWMAVTLPVSVVCMFGLGFLVFRKLPRQADQNPIQELKQRYRKLGKITRGEKNVLAAALFAVTLWIGPSFLRVFLDASHPLVQWPRIHFPEAAVALVAAGLLFILPAENKTPTLKWAQAKSIDWGSLLLFGSGLSLSQMMFDTGLATQIGQTLMQVTGQSFWLFVFASVIFAMFFTETTSNTATASMLIPLVIAASQQGGFSPLLPTFGVAMACSYAFMLPVATPPNAIVFGTGDIRVQQMIRMGWWLTLVCGAIVLVALWITQLVLTS